MVEIPTSTLRWLPWLVGVSIAVFVPISVWFADHFDSRQIFTAAIALFTLPSPMACANPLV